MIEPEEEAYADPIPELLRQLLASGKDTKDIKAKLAVELSVAPDEVLRRWSELPNLEPTGGPHAPLLLEARELYRHGHFYSCVTMCGVTSERIIKDILCERLAIWVDDQAVDIPAEAVSELDRFELGAIARFLTKAKLLVPDARKAVLKLAEIRNTYAHGSGMKPQEDALKAVGLLHAVVSRTASLFASLPRFGSAQQADSLLGSTGSFGRVPSNPIPGDYVQYCSQLRCPKGHPYHFKLRGTVSEVAPDQHIVDRVSLLCFEGESNLDLFFDAYHAGVSVHTPEGLGQGEMAGKRHSSGPGPLTIEGN
jgi:hypothetical protein